MTRHHRQAAALLVVWACLAMAAVDAVPAPGLRAPGGAPAAPAELAQRPGLPDPATARLAAAQARDVALRAVPERETVSDDALRQLERELVAALAAAPEDAAVAEALHDFYWRWGARLEAPSAAALDLVARAPDPARLALRLAGRPRYHPHAVELLLAALAVRPGAAVLWAAAGEAARRVDWKIAFLEQSFRCLVPPASEPRPEDAPAIAAVAESWLRELLAAGLAPRALAVLASLPPAVRAPIEGGGAGPVDAALGGLPFAGELRDLRLDLALAEILAGNTPAARRRLLRLPTVPTASIAPIVPTAPTVPIVPTAPTVPTAPPTPAANPAGREPAPAERRAAGTVEAAGLERRILERWLAPSRAEDPFDLFTGALADPPDGDLADGLRSICWRLALAQAAQREAYPAIASFISFQAASRLGNAVAGDEPTRTGRGVPPSVLMAARGLTAEIAALARQLGDDARAARAELRAGLGPDPAAAAIARLLHAPPGPRFAARSLAALSPATGPSPATGRPPNAAPPPVPAARRAAPAMRPRPPEGFTAVRTDRQGKRVVMIARSAHYDRPTPLSRGGYWVLLSDDLGTTWLPPLYTGLRDNLPYTVRPTSTVPLLAGDRLQVEVEIKELPAHAPGAAPAAAAPAGVAPSNLAPSDLAPADPAPATPAPADLAPRPPQTGLYLDIPLADLERDSDGDGLTDLAEERLLTDPGQADTDRDGLADGEDPTPTIATTEPPAPEAPVLAAVLAETVDKPRPVARPRRQPVARGGCCQPPPGRAFGEQTLFVVGERPMFAGLRPSHRLIVLAPEEAETLRRTVSDPFSLTFDLVVLDRSGRRAFIVWSTANADARLLLEERGGAWRPVASR